MISTIIIAVVPVLVGTALGMFEPLRRGHPIPIVIFFVTRYDWWPYILLPFFLYGGIAFGLVHFIYRTNLAFLDYRDAAQYGITAWTLTGYVCALPALFARSETDN